MVLIKRPTQPFCSYIFTRTLAITQPDVLFIMSAHLVCNWAPVLVRMSHPSTAACQDVPSFVRWPVLCVYTHVYLCPCVSEDVRFFVMLVAACRRFYFHHCKNINLHALPPLSPQNRYCHAHAYVYMIAMSRYYTPRCNLKDLHNINNPI